MVEKVHSQPQASFQDLRFVDILRVLRLCKKHDYVDISFYTGLGLSPNLFTGTRELIGKDDQLVSSLKLAEKIALDFGLTPAIEVNQSPNGTVKKIARELFTLRNKQTASLAQIKY